MTKPNPPALDDLIRYVHAAIDKAGKSPDMMPVPTKMLVEALPAFHEACEERGIPVLGNPRNPAAILCRGVWVYPCNDEKIIEEYQAGLAKVAADNKLR